MSCCVDGVVVSQISDYWKLLKPRVMCLVIFTFITGLMIAPGEIHPFTAIVATLCVALGGGAAGALNMWYDRDIDVIMRRTKNRPIPSGVIRAGDALEFAVILALTAVFIMAIAVGYLTALLLVFSILVYVLLYTVWLKRSTPQNIVIGGIAGALPPVIGWAAVTGNVSWESLVLLMIIFVWTPPHFWSLSLLISDDYERAGVPMMPVVRGVECTAVNILIYSVLVVLVAILPGLFVRHCAAYEVIAGILGIVFIWCAVDLLIVKSEQACKRLFFYSMFYLFSLFTSIIACSVF